MKNIIENIENKITNDKILFFDLDGTLVETDYSNFLAYNKAINFVLGKNLLYNPNERFTREKLKKIFPNLTMTEIQTIIEQKEIFYNNFLHETKLNFQLYGLLKNYYKTNRTFLVTNCRKNRATKILQYHQINNKFETVFYRKIMNGVKINKFKNAISELKVNPKKIIVFENDCSEISNAINIGIPKENIIKI